jgi:glycerophosphoryl diester phosphodiesterase
LLLKKVLGWSGMFLMVVMALGLGLAVVVASATMGRVCTDAKAAAALNFRELPFFAGLPPVLDIAHRGASELAPEHSLVAYELALLQGAHVLELDLRLLRDGELVIAHDRTLKRTLGLDRAFSELSLPELRAIAGSAMPLGLDQVFRQFPGARFNLELKDESLEAPRALAAIILREGAQASSKEGESDLDRASVPLKHRVLVASSHRPVLEEFRRQTSGAVATSASAEEALDYYVCYLMRRTCPSDYSALQLPPLGWLGLTSAAFIEAAHERGLCVHFWTVDDPAQMRALLSAGADGLMTNRPDVLGRVLGERG